MSSKTAPSSCLKTANTGKSQKPVDNTSYNPISHCTVIRKGLQAHPPRSLYKQKRPTVYPILLSHYRQVERLSGSRLKRGVADDLLHDSRVLQGPRALVGIRERDVDVLPAYNDDGAHSADNLTPQIRVDVGARSGQADRLNGLRLPDPNGVALDTGEGEAPSQARILDEHADLVVGVDMRAAALGGGAGGGEDR